MRKSSSATYQAQVEVKQRIESQRKKAGTTAATESNMIAPCKGFIVEDLSPSSKFIKQATQIQLQPDIFELEHLVANDGDLQVYRTHFYGKDHKNLLGTLADQCISVSLRKQQVPRSQEKVDGQGQVASNIYKGLLRIEDSFMYASKTEAEILEYLKQANKHRFFSSKPSTKEVLISLFPQCEFAKLKEVDDIKLPIELLSIEDKLLENKFKFGLILVKEGQGNSEDAIFSNDGNNEAYQKFLSCVGTKVTLKGFQGFRGGLDVKDGTSGIESVVAKYKGMEVMYHVSTMLPLTTEKQQLARKAHVGNDLGILVFKTSSQPFDPTCLVSQFPHYFVVVEPIQDSDSYRVSIARKDDVPEFGPHIMEAGIFKRGVDFQQFLLAKLINGETAAYQGVKFTALRSRTRKAVLEELNRSYLRRSNTASTSSLQQWTSQFFGKDEPTSPKVSVKRLSSSYNLTSRNSVKRRTDYAISSLDTPVKVKQKEAIPLPLSNPVAQERSKSNPKLPKSQDVEAPLPHLRQHRGSSPLPMPLPPKTLVSIAQIIESNNHLHSDDEFGTPITTHKTFNDDGTPILSPLSIQDDSKELQALQAKFDALSIENMKLKLQLQIKLNDEIVTMLPVREELQQTVDQQRLRLKLKKAQAFIEALLFESEDIIDEIAL